MQAEKLPAISFDKRLCSAEIQKENGIPLLSITALIAKSSLRTRIFIKTSDGKETSLFDETKSCHIGLSIRIDAFLDYCTDQNDLHFEITKNGEGSESRAPAPERPPSCMDLLTEFASSNYLSGINVRIARTKVIEFELGPFMKVSPELLALHSDYFEDLFYSKTHDLTKPILIEYEENLEEFELMIKAIEKRKFALATVFTAIVLITRADFYKVHSLQRLCRSFLLNTELSLQREFELVVLAAQRKKDEQLMDHALKQFKNKNELQRVIDVVKPALNQDTEELLNKALSTLPNEA